MRGLVVAKCAASGNAVCEKSVHIFSACYGSEVGVAALKWLPYGGLCVRVDLPTPEP